MKRKSDIIMSQLITLITTLFLIVTAHSCKNEPKPVASPQEIKKYKEPLVQVNKHLVEKDRIRIEKYAKRRNWDMEKSETGLYYKISGEGTGELAIEGDLVTIDYDLLLLDGTLCYSTDSTGAESFVVGYEDVESGLDEGIRLMKSGQSAKLIIPPHLAHGLLGDQNKIPPRSIILFELKLLEVKRD